MLKPYKECHMMSVKDKKAWWGKRRIAVGGKTDEGDESDGNDTESESGEKDESELQLPSVNQGLGSGRMDDRTLQPLCYKELPI
eukprot:8873839-Karenia_brevis.AAC.1